MTPNEIKQTKSQIGFEFEFLRDPKYNLGEIKKKIKKIFKVDVKLEKEHHSDFIPTNDHWKMEPDFSGGVSLVEVVTGPISYPLARIVLLNMLKFIREDKKISLNERCGIHININIEGRYIQNIDILKYIIDFDEDLVYKYFPDRKNNIYAKTIKSIFPRHGSYAIDNLTFNKTNYVFPSNKYYGINFTKLSKGYLEFRYLGGPKYAIRSDETIELMDYFIDSLILSYNKPYDKEDNKILKSIVDKKHKLFLASKDYFNFKNIFKKLKLSVDGNDNSEAVKSQFHKIIQVFFPLMQQMENIPYGMAGKINYDSDESLLEFVDISFKDTVIDSHRVIFHNCRFIQCVIDNAILQDSKTSKCDLTNTDTISCDLKKTRLKDGHHESGKVINGYINGKFITLDRMQIKGNTIFREGKYVDTEIDDSVEVIDAEEAQNN